jgi:DNA-binding transcriptional LysR family regulator
MTTTIAESAVAAAEAGLGITQLTSYQAEQGIRDRRLVVLLTEFECQTTPVNLVYTSNRLLPVKVRAFIDFDVPRLRERLRSVEKSIGSGTPAIGKAPAKQRGRGKTG